MFLPQIEEANKQLEEEIKRTGKSSKQIDVDLAVEGSADAAPSLADESEGKDNDQTVKLEFALGDFDDTLIAAIEDEKESAAVNEHETDDEIEDRLDIQVLKIPHRSA